MSGCLDITILLSKALDCPSGLFEFFDSVFIIFYRTYAEKEERFKWKRWKILGECQ